MVRAALKGSLAPALVLALALALAAPAAAHYDSSEAIYDPLILNAPLYLAPGGALQEAAPAAGSAYFAAYDPTTGPVALNFSLVAPLPFQLGHGLDITLVVAADKPVVPAQDASGNALELSVWQDGTLLKESVKPMGFGKPALAPGDAVTTHALLQMPSAKFAKGSAITLRVRPTLPALVDGALKLALGAAGSTAVLDSMRVPTVQDLELEDGGLAVFDPRTTAFQPSESNAVVYTAVVAHDRIDLADIHETQGRKVYLVLKGDEPPGDAHRYHDALTRDERRAAAHALMVGATLVRVHPGVAVVVPIGSGPAPVVITCAANCPLAPGWRATIGFQGTAARTGATAAGDASALIPPPPPTTGIAVSKDAPAATKQTAGAGPWLVISAAVAAIACAPRRRGRRRG